MARANDAADVPVTRWPPAAVFPDSAPRVGIRADRHDVPGRAIAYKLWINDQGGVETGVYRPEHKAEEVAAFLAEVRATVISYAELPGDYINTDGEAMLAWDVVDIILDEETGGEGCSIGMGILGVGPSLRRSEVLALVVEDVDERLRIGS